MMGYPPYFQPTAETRGQAVHSWKFKYLSEEDQPY